MRWFELRLPPQPTMVGIARSTTAAAAAVAGLGSEVIEDCRTCISEAVTNAVRAHAAAGLDDPVLVRLGAGDGSMVLEVHDHGEGPPDADRRPTQGTDLDSLTEGGFGIPVMRALADAVDIAAGAEGGTVVTLHFAG